ncbi:hypothetical protein C0Q70_03418 [Pomacea canaliculata]|uniref:NAD-dependent epimerase/dehydratase domain-containing protein n=1 Tax=Pomacea canaliculata TaxID=400727 RepID=A0A2T7PSP7_POMCA|nr:hypothetical protein C0Q70_03418 [Pomacea canaliculata]
MYGTGFIGRNFVHYLVTKDLASKIRVADKVPPQMAWMNPVHSAAFASPIVEFKHSNLISSTSAENAFSTDGEPFDYVVNFAAETKYGQSEPVYHEGIVRLSENCARTAARCNVQMYVELSSGQMLSSDKKPTKEDSKCNPWTNLARHKLAVEELLKDISGLNYAVIRPAIVYGPGDRQGITPRLLIGAIYRYTKEKMKMLWTKDLHMNTVHVEDVCAAVWHVFTHAKPGQLFNLVDKGDTTQGKISELVSQLFSIQYDFMGSVLSSMAKVNMSNVVEDINDKHMAPWADACQRDNIVNTPLTPFIDQELLYNKHLHMDGTKIEQTGFHYSYPELQLQTLRQVLDDYIQMGLFPRCLLEGDTYYDRPADDYEEGGVDEFEDH